MLLEGLPDVRVGALARVVQDQDGLVALRVLVLYLAAFPKSTNLREIWPAEGFLEINAKYTCLRYQMQI